MTAFLAASTSSRLRFPTDNFGNFLSFFFTEIFCETTFRLGRLSARAGLARVDRFAFGRFVSGRRVAAFFLGCFAKTCALEDRRFQPEVKAGPSYPSATFYTSSTWEDENAERSSSCFRRSTICFWRLTTSPAVT